MAKKKSKARATAKGNKDFWTAFAVVMGILALTWLWVKLR